MDQLLRVKGPIDTDGEGLYTVYYRDRAVHFRLSRHRVSSQWIVQIEGNGHTVQMECTSAYPEEMYELTLSRIQQIIDRRLLRDQEAGH